MNVALVPHPPSDETKRFIRTQPGEWVIYQYNLHLEQFQDLGTEIINTARRIAEKTPITRAGRILLAPPGLSITVLPLAEALRGMSGITPEILLLMRSPNGEYAPCPELPVFSPRYSYNETRRWRGYNEGVVA